MPSEVRTPIESSGLLVLGSSTDALTPPMEVEPMWQYHSPMGMQAVHREPTASEPLAHVYFASSSGYGVWHAVREVLVDLTMRTELWAEIAGPLLEDLPPAGLRDVRRVRARVRSRYRIPALPASIDEDDD